MAFDTYANLKTSIGKWLWRPGDPDIDDIAADLITLCEDMINNGSDGIPPLRASEMLTTDSIALTSGAGTLPTDFLSAREATVGQGRALKPAPATFASQDTLYATGGRGEYFTVGNGTISSYPQDTGPLTLTYYAKVPALSNSNTTNWLLLKSPRIYLFGSLMQGQAFMQEDERIPVWAMQYQQALAALQGNDTLAQYGRAAQRPSVIGF